MTNYNGTRRHRSRQKQYPERNAIYRVVRAAIKSGALIRPDTCGRCGDKPAKAIDGRSRIHAHHHDYSKPLEVEWICSYCHGHETVKESGFLKLTETKVRSIKENHKNGMSQRVLAKHFRVERTVIRAILNGTSWRHV